MTLVDTLTPVLEAIHPYLAYGSVALLLAVPFLWLCWEVAGVWAEYRSRGDASGVGENEKQNGDDRPWEGGGGSERPRAKLRPARLEGCTYRRGCTEDRERPADYKRGRVTNHRR